MSTCSAALGMNGTAVTLNWRNREYKIRPLTWGIIAEMERWLIQRDIDTKTAAYEALVKRGLITPEAVVEKIEALTEEVTQSGKYAFGSAAMNRALFGQETPPAPDQTDEAATDVANLDPATFSAKMKLFSLMLGCEVDELLNLFHEKQAELLAKIKLVFAESMPRPKDEPAP